MIKRLGSTEYFCSFTCTNIVTMFITILFSAKERVAIFYEGVAIFIVTEALQFYFLIMDILQSFFFCFFFFIYASVAIFFIFCLQECFNFIHLFYFILFLLVAIILFYFILFLLVAILFFAYRKVILFF